MLQSRGSTPPPLCHRAGMSFSGTNQHRSQPGSTISKKRKVQEGSAEGSPALKKGPRSKELDQVMIQLNLLLICCPFRGLSAAITVQPAKLIEPK
jgi:hypothetical protein